MISLNWMMRMKMEIPKSIMKRRMRTLRRLSMFVTRKKKN